jgi:formate dehydrogenase accessory protein FdhD
MDRGELRAVVRGVTERGVTRLGGARSGETDLVVVEEPLEIRVDGERLAVTMRTPGHDERLALGFLLSEGLIAGAADVSSIAPCGRPGEEGYGNVIDVRSAPGTPIVIERVLESRRFTTTSACGVCGRESVDGLLARCGVVPPGPAIDPARVSRAVEALREAQPNFERTGGIHAAGLFDAAGRKQVVHEDIGRHNAVDKVVGAALLQKLPATLLAVSGRVSFEIVQKAVMAHVPVVAGVSAASSLAIDLASRSGITLLSFVRGGAMNVYSGAERLVPGILPVDGDDGSLAFLPLAARRALDVAGFRLSLDTWTAWPLAQRRALVAAGAGDAVDVAEVERLCAGVPRIAPDPGPEGDRALPPLERWAAEKLRARGKVEKLAALLRDLEA